MTKTQITYIKVDTLTNKTPKKYKTFTPAATFHKLFVDVNGIITESLLFAKNAAKNITGLNIFLTKPDTENSKRFVQGTWLKNFKEIRPLDG